MITGVSDYNLVPLKTYPDNRGRTTTITDFEDRLQSSQASLRRSREEADVSESGQTAGQSGQDTAAARSGVTADTKSTQSAASDQETGEVYFRDPSTGAAVRYVDVAKERDKASASGQTSSVKTDTASSMKKTKYEEYFQKAAAKYNISASLLKAIAKAESNFNANAVSSAGAMGVMQLMPATAEGLGVKNPYDPEQNIMGGARCIAMKLKEFNGDVRLALAAYNAGSGAVRRNGGVPSYCRTYVNKVLSYKEAYETAKAVG